MLGRLQIEVSDGAERCVRLAPMPIMVPTGLADGPHLAAVLPSCVAAMRGERNELRLPPLRSAVVALVDGLGMSDLRAHSGHARTLVSAIGSRSLARTGGPTTTAAAIASLTTGVSAGTHGIVGYAVRDPETGMLVNQLSGWGSGSVQPQSWQRVPTVFEQHPEIRSVVVGQSRYESSGFTAAVLRGAEYIAVNDMTERVEAAAELTRGPEPVLVYLYVPELDMAAHASGTSSGRWISALETLDAAMKSSEAALARDAALLVTADHGMVDVPSSSHVAIDESARLVDGVDCVGGDPRLVHLYLEDGADVADVAALAEAWRAQEGSRAWVLTRDEAIAAGIFGATDPTVAPRIGDVLIAARERVAYYDTRTASTASRAMVGQHGSFTAEEREVPLLRFGAARR